MLIQITSDLIVNTKEIIGIFDFDNCTTGKRTLNLLKRAQNEGLIEDSNFSLPRSFLILNDEKEKIIFSSTTTTTIKKKIEILNNL